MPKKINATSKELFYDSFSGQWEEKINNAETNKRLFVVFNLLLNKKDLKSKNFLEVGCGMGYFSNLATKAGAKVTGVDVGPKLIAICKSKNKKAKFMVASASSLPFKDSSFDILLSTEVIEHVENQNKAIKEMARVLKRNGILVITTPNKLFKPLFDFLSKIGIRPYNGNEKWFYPWELKKLLERNSLKVVKEYHFNFIYPVYFFDQLENLPLFNIFCINFAFKLRKV